MENILQFSRGERGAVRPRERSPFEARRSLWHPRPLELQRLNASAAIAIGEHDFRAFTPTETQHKTFIRIVEDARWYDRGDASPGYWDGTAWTSGPAPDAKAICAPNILHSTPNTTLEISAPMPATAL